MIYGLLHKLLGWDYILWENTADRGIARVHVHPITGSVWYWRYKNIRKMDMVENSEQVFWLTCSPDKYLGEK